MFLEAAPVDQKRLYLSLFGSKIYYIPGHLNCFRLNLLQSTPNAVPVNEHTRQPCVTLLRSSRGQPPLTGAASERCETPVPFSLGEIALPFLP